MHARVVASVRRRWRLLQITCLRVERAVWTTIRKSCLQAAFFLTLASVISAMVFTPGLWCSIRRSYPSSRGGALIPSERLPLTSSPTADDIYSSLKPDPMAAGPLPCNLTARHRNINVVVARLVGNNMPPLQGVDQIKNNIEFILENEDPIVTGVVLASRMGHLRSVMVDFSTISAVRKSKISDTMFRYLNRSGHPTRTVPVDYADAVQKAASERACEAYHPDENSFSFFVQRFWLINRMLNETARNAIVSLLDAEGEAYVEVPLNVELARRSVNPLLYVTNQNAARNIALQEAISLGARWILPFDGNVFLTEEAWRSALFTLSKAELSDSKYVFTPMYRFLADQESDIINRTSTFEQLAYNLARAEVQLMFRNDAPRIFDENVGYGARNKFDLVQDLKENYLSTIWCPNADIGFDLGKWKVNTERLTHKKCGFSLRLSYWSDYDRDEWRTLTDAQSRHNRRMNSRTVLSYMIADTIFFETWFEEYGLLFVGSVASFWSGVLAFVIIFFVFNRLGLFRDLCCRPQRNEV